MRGELTIAACSGCASGTLMTSIRKSAEFGSLSGVNLTQPEIAAQLRKNPLVLLPTGSIEQHGPHLPTGTDIFASNVIGAAVAERMDGLLLPAIMSAMITSNRVKPLIRMPSYSD